MPRAWVGLGSNLGNSCETLCRAIGELDLLAETRLAARSRIYRTPPWGKLDQPDFFNAVAGLDTALEAERLLDELLALERRHGRVRRERWGARTLDLDLLLYAGMVIDTPRLKVPHPRLVERGFMLMPLAELVPGLEVPGRGQVIDLLARVDVRGIDVVMCA